MIYAIGDVHGQAVELDRVLALIEADGGPDADVVFLGDYTDRGPDSRGVLDRLVAGGREGRRWTMIRGNHDRMFLRFLEHGTTGDAAIDSGATWLHPALGGPATLASYGVAVPDGSAHDPAALARVRADARDAVPQPHRTFLAGLPLTRLTDDQLFVHAGIRPGIPLEAQDEEDLLWIRTPFLEDRRDHGRLVVHGHTRAPSPEHHGNRLSLDVGAGYGNPLVAVAIEGRDAWVLTPRARVPIPPRHGSDG